MSKHPLQTALEELQKDGFDFTIRSYSGRFMYGKSCLAIAGEFLNIFHIGVEVGRKLDSSDFNWKELESFCYDSMGLGMVYYWKRIPYEEDEEDYEIEDDE